MLRISQIDKKNSESPLSTHSSSQSSMKKYFILFLENSVNTTKLSKNNDVNRALNLRKKSEPCFEFFIWLGF